MVFNDNEPHERIRAAAGDNTGGGSYYGNNKLFWDPTAALLTSNGKILSPATVLNHEIDHALDDKLNPKEHKENSRKGSDAQYDTKEEKRVIEGSEQETAKKHGEINEGEVTRTDHQMSTRNTQDPTSNKNTTERPVELDEIIIKKQ